MCNLFFPFRYGFWGRSCSGSGWEVSLFLSESEILCTKMDLPEGRKHYDSRYEGDERGGVAHGVDLSERGEVVRLGRET